MRGTLPLGVTSLKGAELWSFKRRQGGAPCNFYLSVSWVLCAIIQRVSLPAWGIWSGRPCFRGRSDLPISGGRWEGGYRPRSDQPALLQPASNLSSVTEVCPLSCSLVILEQLALETFLVHICYASPKICGGLLATYLIPLDKNP
jgi:hypothetical protein